jgi:glutamate-1-semialdehyde 2,1-aminomutase
MKFNQSNILFNKVKKLIPLGSQTFSKSYRFLPKKNSPLFIKKGNGCYFWDEDNNKFIDMVSGLLSVTIGYNVKEINLEIRKQMNKGISFSLATKLEYQLAKKINKHVPCAEMVRYAKNGSDVTTAAIRLARNITKHTNIMFSGYHGWHDWYIGSTSMNNGVPNEIRKQSFNFEFNNFNSFLKQYKKANKKVAAVIIEPMNIIEPEKKFLKQLRAFCTKNKIILIFDEICTGFRFSMGGAQEIFNVTPDLTTLGKGIANGFPLSVLAGKKKYMNKCEDIFFSSTFGGETLSLSAAISVINFFEKKKVINHFYKMGGFLKNEITNFLRDKNIGFVDLVGNPTWTFFIYKDFKNYKKEEIKTFFIQEVIKRGVFTFGTNNINFSHKKKHIKNIIKVYKEVIILIDKKTNNKEKLLNYKPIKNLFTVRK